MTNQEKPFSDISPYDSSEFHEKISHLVKEPGFEHAVKWVLKDIDYADFCNQLLLVKDGNTFKRNNDAFLELLVAKQLQD